MIHVQTSCKNERSAYLNFMNSSESQYFIFPITWQLWINWFSTSHSTRLSIFYYDLSNDIFILLMHLVIWMLFNFLTVIENKRDLWNCDFNIDQFLVWFAAIEVELCLKHEEKKLNYLSILICTINNKDHQDLNEWSELADFKEEIIKSYQFMSSADEVENERSCLVSYE